MTTIDETPLHRYRVIVVDAPWNQGKTGCRQTRPRQSTRLDYPVMNKEALLSLPVGDWAAPQCFLWIWATNSKDKKTGEPILITAFDLMKAWGFQYSTLITWNKQTGVCPFSPYQITTEHLLFGYRGKGIYPKHLRGKLKTCFTETSTVHSVKTDSFYREIASLFEAPRPDVFARQVREGFDGWGNEYGTLTHKGCSRSGVTRVHSSRYHHSNSLKNTVFMNSLPAFETTMLQETEDGT